MGWFFKVNEMLDENKIGDKIRHVRKNNKMTVDELAEATNCSVNFLTDLENGAYIPSLTPLMKIARALGVRLGTFLDDALQTGPFVVKSGKSENIIHFSGSYSNLDESTLDFYSLAYGKQGRHMEPFIIDVTPKKGENKLSSHEGEEFIYVLDGEIIILYGQDKYNLKKGDSIYYDSIIPHEVHAADNEDAKILAVLYAPL